MPKFRVYAIATSSYFVGEYEAATEEEARQMADDAPQNDQPCHQCAADIELGDWYEYQIEVEG